MKVIITRHAETNNNANQINSGQGSEVFLNDKGKEQAKKLADFLKNEKITFAYVSPQTRAVQTAKEVLKYHPSAKVVSSHYLKEQNLGVFEQRPRGEWKEFKKTAKEPFHLLKPEGGESYAELQNRASSFFNGLAKNHKNDTVLVVSHAGTIGMMLLDILQKPITRENYESHKPENTALTVLEISENSSHKLHFLNDTRHLS